MNVLIPADAPYRCGMGFGSHASDARAQHVLYPFPTIHQPRAAIRVRVVFSADFVDGIATRFDKGAHRICGFGLTEQNAVDAARENLAKLPRIVAHDLLVRALHRGFDNDGRRPVPAVRRPARDQPAHVLVQPGQIERPMFHTHIDVIRPSAGVFLALLKREHMPGVRAHVINGLILRQQFNCAIDAIHFQILSVSSQWSVVSPAHA